MGSERSGGKGECDIFFPTSAKDRYNEPLSNEFIFQMALVLGEGGELLSRCPAQINCLRFCSRSPPPPPPPASPSRAKPKARPPRSRRRIRGVTDLQELKKNSLACRKILNAADRKRVVSSGTYQRERKRRGGGKWGVINSDDDCNWCLCSCSSLQRAFLE